MSIKKTGFVRFPVRQYTGYINIPEILIGLSDDDLNALVFEIKNNAEVAGLSGQDNWVYVIGSLLAEKPLSLDDLDMMISGTLDKEGAPEIVEGAAIPDGMMKTVEAIIDQLDVFDDTISDGGAKLNTSDKSTVNIPVTNGGTFVLNGGGDVEFDKAKTINITGEGTLIIDGSLTVKHSNLEINISDGITLLVAGEFKAENHVTLNSGDGAIYIQDQAELNNTVDFNLGGGFFVGGDCLVKNSSEVEGFLFVQGQLEANNSLNVDGMLLADSLVLKNNADFNINADAMPDWLYQILDGMGLLTPGPSTTGNGVESVVRSGWTRSVHYQ